VVLENARELVMGGFRPLNGLLADLSTWATPIAAPTSSTASACRSAATGPGVAALRSLPRRDLADLWAGWRVSPKATMSGARSGSSAGPGGAADPGDDLHVSPA